MYIFTTQVHIATEQLYTTEYTAIPLPHIKLWYTLECWCYSLLREKCSSIIILCIDSTVHIQCLPCTLNFIYIASTKSYKNASAKTVNKDLKICKVHSEGGFNLGPGWLIAWF